MSILSAYPSTLQLDILQLAT
uniref:Uncharacterized protein n=1 Tax=Anguilla anguilla TaxID=7936 RepID=A0A0E9UCJ7_ANGAN